MPLTDFNEKPIESEVFRFVSVRNPQRITPIQAHRISINYYLGASSDLYDDLAAAIADPANASNEDKRAACKALAEAYREGDNWITDVVQLKDLLPDNYLGLYDWLESNLATLTITGVTEKFTTVYMVSPELWERLWDNLFARVILGGDGPTRAEIMEALCINNIATHYDDEVIATDDDMKSLARAKVILPSGVFPLPAIRGEAAEFDYGPGAEEKEALDLAIAAVGAHIGALNELEDLRKLLWEELLLTSMEEEYTEETPFDPSLLNFLLTEGQVAALSAPTADVLDLYGLGVGKRLSFCIDTVARKLESLQTDLLGRVETGRRVIAAGGAIWEPSPAKVGEAHSCDPVALPDTGSDDDYKTFYGGDAQCKIKPLGIADLLRVEQKLCCYAPGEVAHIENILQGEYKERSTRRLHRTEDTFITGSERETLNERDTITTTQHELQQATASVLQEDTSFNAGMSLGYRGKAVNFNLSTGFATSNSSNVSNSSATVYAQSVTERALERVIERTYQERTSKIINEYEENNKHGLDNRGGTAHVVGLYRWADKIYEAKLVNYGKRLMFEFMIPEPGAFHLWAMSKPSAATAVELVEPRDPRLGIPSLQLLPLTVKAVWRTNWYVWGALYDVALAPPPPEFVQVSLSKFETVVAASEVSYAYETLIVPTGYVAKTAKVAVAFRETGATLNTSWLTLQVGGHAVNLSVNTTTVFPPLDDVSDFVAVSAIGGDLYHFAINVTVTCERTDKFNTEWQRDCYEKIIQAYLQKKAAYDEALAQTKSGYGNGYFGTNPAMNRETERNELRKACLNALHNGADFSSDGVANYYTDNGVINTDLTTDCFPPIGQMDCCTVFQGERARFLEQVFDWDMMGYMFYPYFHGKRCRWKMLYQLQDSDPDFLRFLQAGMARVLVPVRLGFEEVAMYYLSTGQIWGGGPVPAIKSDLYMSIVQELMGAVLYTGQTVSPTTWEVRVPTTLTVLQCASGCISGEGLPCDCGTGIGTGESLMVGGETEPTLHE